MRRGDVAVFSISAALGAVVIAAVAFSVLVVDRPGEDPERLAADSISSLLVVTWAPSLCAVEQSNPGCRSGHVEAMGPTLMLHGLWPQPPTEQFCGVPRGGDDGDAGLSSLNLPQNVQANLQSMMSDVDVMAPHEWKAHGTCSGVTPTEYFTTAAVLARQVTEILDPVFNDARGGHVSLNAIRDRLDADFGDEAGERVGLDCHELKGAGVVAYEVHVSLPRVPDLKPPQGDVSLKDVITKGPPIAAGCRRGSVP